MAQRAGSAAATPERDATQDPGIVRSNAGPRATWSSPGWSMILGNSESGGRREARAAPTRPELRLTAFPSPWGNRLSWTRSHFTRGGMPQSMAAPNSGERIAGRDCLMRGP